MKNVKMFARNSCSDRSLALACQVILAGKGRKEKLNCEPISNVLFHFYAHVFPAYVACGPTRLSCFLLLLRAWWSSHRKGLPPWRWSSCARWSTSWRHSTEVRPPCP